MKKRLISLLLAAVMLFSMISAVSAENTVAENAETPVIAAQEVWGKAGTMVEVNVTITGNPGLLGAVVNVSWDEKLTLIKASSGSAFADLAYQEPSKFSHTGTNFVWYGLELETVSDGTILTLTYQISEDAQEWDQYGIYLTCKSSDFYDQNQNTVNVSTVNGSALVLSYMPGDVNEDGSITVWDLILLSQYISDGCITDPEGYNVTLNAMAADVDNSGYINTRDLILMAQYISDEGTDPEGYNVTLLPYVPGCIHSEMEYVAAKAATCTEDGNIEYWYCPECGEYFGDESANEKLLETIDPKTGHTYSEAWSSDRSYHWHNAICEHPQEVADRESHTLDDQGVCTVCAYNTITVVQLDTPVISGIAYDCVTWEPVESAEYYTVRVNDNYECTLRGTSCDISYAQWNGKPITKHGLISVEVRALGYTAENGETIYTASSWSDKNTSYYYVPRTESENAKTAIKYSLGYGYNLVEDPYLDTRTHASTNSVLDINKLLTVGEYTEGAGTAGGSEDYYYTSVEDFLSKTRLDVDVGVETGCALIGTIQSQFQAHVGFDYSTHKYFSTYIGKSWIEYNDRRIVNFDAEKLQYCLSDLFLQDIRRESKDTKGMTDKQLAYYIYDNYGTHAILGVNTGGVYISQYTIATDSSSIAADVKLGFKTSTGGGAVDAIIQNNFNVGVAVEQAIETSSANTEAKFTTYYFGGQGNVTTSMNGYNDARASWSVNEDTATATGFTNDGVIAISTLLQYIDPALATAFYTYVDGMSSDIKDKLVDEWQPNNTQDYIYISSAMEFDDIRNNRSGYYILTDDIDLGELGEMEPISNFTGVLDGRGYTVRGWTYQQKTVGNIGIFGENSGTICNLNLTDCEITTDVSPMISGQLNAGILCGKNNGSIENVKIWDCHYHTDVGGIDMGAHTITYAGFVCGENWGNILKCSVLNSDLYAYTGTEWWSSWTLAGSIVGNVKAGTVQDVLASGNTIKGTAEATSKGWPWCAGHGELNVAVGGIAGWAHEGTVRRAVSQDNTLTAEKKRKCGCSDLMRLDKGYLFGYLENTTLIDCYAQTGKTLIGGGNSSTGAYNVLTEEIKLNQLSQGFQDEDWKDNNGRVLIDHTVMRYILAPEYTSP